MTGRTWEVKDNAPNSLHYKGHTYSWYNPDSSTNGGGPGPSGAGNCNATLPVSGQYTGCDTYTFPKYVNDNGGLCGFKDWRVPEIQELRSIVDYSVAYPGPTIDANYFPNTMTILDRTTWAATPQPYTAGSAGAIRFSWGSASGGNQSAGRHGVRLVRGGQ